MKYGSIHTHILVKTVVSGLLMIGLSTTIQANTVSPDDKSAKTDPFTSKARSFSQFLEDRGILVGGWVNGGATFNPSQTDGFNGPVTFADQANRAQLNQFNLFIDRSVKTEGKGWDFGFRGDFMFGTDAIFTQAYGNPAFDVNNGRALADRGNWDLNICCSSLRTYGIAIPQAFFEVYAPFGNGINVKVGHFYTPIGFESVPAPNNFFYTHAYTMQYGEPFTHTGVMGTYRITKNFETFMGAIGGSGTGGWDGNFDRQMGNWGGLGGLTWTSNDAKTSVNVSGTGSTASTRNSSFWGMYSIVIRHRVLDKVQLVVQHDHGFADNVLLANLHYAGVNKDAAWYGVNTHVYYDVSRDLSVGVRAEWFRDRDGFRVFSPGRVAAATNHLGNSYALGGSTSLASSTPADYYAVTIGANWKVVKALNLKWKGLNKLNLRPNIRWDRADGLHAAYRPYGGNKDQILFSLDAMLPF